jgi:hypothetical protein
LTETEAEAETADPGRMGLELFALGLAALQAAMYVGVIGQSAFPYIITRSQGALRAPDF